MHLDNFEKPSLIHREPVFVLNANLDQFVRVVVCSMNSSIDRSSVEDYGDPFQVRLLLLMEAIAVLVRNFFPDLSCL